MRGREHGSPQIRSSVPLIEHMGLLAGGIRLELLIGLADAPKDVSTLAEELGLAVNYVSQALRLLREYGLVEVTQRQKYRIHQLSSRVHIAVRESLVHIAVASANGDLMFLQTAHPSSRSTTNREPNVARLLELVQQWFKSDGHESQPATATPDRPLCRAV